MARLGYLIRILHAGSEQAITSALAQMELTSAQGHIMGFLAHCDAPPCPKDVEEKFCLSHPTVSGLLSRLEKKEFIALLPDEKDRRCKRIHVLPKGRDCHGSIHAAIRSNEERMVQGFSEEEKQLFAEFLTRAVRNLDSEAKL